MHLQKSKFHFIGIGGIGMCGLAELMKRLGASVSGSDVAENANTERLRALGVEIHKGHKKENVGDVDVLVYSSAISADNPEMQEALARQIPTIPRAEALAEIMRIKRGVAVAGTHGKTTTTSMTAAIFLAAKTQPTIVVGGRLDLIQSTALLGDGEWMIAEADESDGSFSKLSPELAIITNIDSDHLDYYKTFENLKSAFLNFALKIPFYGSVIVCGDDPAIREIFARFPKRVITYGFQPHNDFVLRGEKGSYELVSGGSARGQFHIHFPGKHNALNAAASFIAGLLAGFSPEVCQQGLESFRGVDRRFQFKGETKDQVLVYDDYGHHPTEVLAALQGFRERFPDRRLVVYFQPHRFSRTQICWHEFTTCFSQSDLLLLGDIYAAGEMPIEGIDSSHLSKEIKHDHVIYAPKGDGQLSLIRQQLKSGDIFVTLGAGDGWKLGQAILDLKS